MKAFCLAVLFAVLSCGLAGPAQAADWRQCKSEKLEAIRLEKALRKGRRLKGYGSGAAMKRERRRIDEWLWKNCRSYYSELRDLYIGRM